MSGKRKTKGGGARGRRVGWKRSDRRWQSEDGTLWDSKFEAQVYDATRASSPDLLRCSEDHTVSYQSPVRTAECLDCGSQRVVQNRTYTADLFVRKRTRRKATVGGPAQFYYVEVKGFFPAPKRALLRYLHASRPDVAMCIVLYSNHSAGKRSVADYIAKYMPRWQCMVWNHKDPAGSAARLQEIIDAQTRA